VRGKIVFILILAMLVTLVYCVGTRTRDAHVMPRPHLEADGGSEAGPAPVVSVATSTTSPVASAAPTDASATLDARVSFLDRPLRLVAASWEYAAAALVANGGHATADGSAVRMSGLELAVDVAGTEHDIENRLARGGGDAEGADVAVLPLPSFVASYERIRALEPQVVHVAGWSRGREVLLGLRDGMLARSGALTGDVAVASSDVPATALALFALDEAGTPAARLHLAPEPKDPTFAALARPLAADRPSTAPGKVQLTTADASRLVPVVAIASRGFVEAHPDVMGALLKAWVAGGTTLRKDVPGAARLISNQSGAPDPAAMLERLAWIGDPGAGDEAFALGAVGKELVTVEWLFARDWRLLRDQGTLTSPAPSSPVVTILPFTRAFPMVPARPEAPAVAQPDVGARTLLAHRVIKGDAASIGIEMASLASIFERSVVRVSARPATLAQEAADSASTNQGIGATHLLVVAAPMTDPGVALLEVLAAP
jgi:hypothetical protein